MAGWKPGPWTKVIHNFLESLSVKNPAKVVVGKDQFGNVYYQEEKRPGDPKAVHRGYHPGSTDQWQRLPVQWEAWLRGRRKHPPSEAEMAEAIEDEARRMQKIQQLGSAEKETAPEEDRSEEAVGESAKFPHIDSKPAEDQQETHRPFPRYSDYEEIAGADKQENFRTDKKD